MASSSAEILMRAGLKPYFDDLLAYAKFVIEKRPDQVVPYKTLSASGWRKEHWEAIARDAARNRIGSLPNPASAADWFPVFRTYKKEVGVRNVPYKTYPQPARGHGEVRFTMFDRALQAYLRPVTQVDDDEDDEEKEDDGSYMATSDDAANTTTSTTRTSVTVSNSSGPIVLDSSGSEDDSHDDDDDDAAENRGPITRSRTAASKRTVIASQYRTAERMVITAPTKPPPPPAEVDAIRHDIGGMSVKAEPPHHFSTQQQRPLAQPAYTPFGRAAAAGAVPPLTPAQSNLPARHFGGQVHTPLAGPMGHGMSAPSGMVSGSQGHLGPMGAVKLLRLIATGGQGSVFLARLVVDENSPLIVKVFYKPPSAHEVSAMRSMAMSNYAVRLLGETRVLKSQLAEFERDLRQQDIDMGWYENGPPQQEHQGWVYERLPGDLEGAILKQPTPIGNAAKQLAALQIAYFLRGIHASGFIFRDLKPSNVLVNLPLGTIKPDQAVRYFLDHYPIIKVTDFGLVTTERSSRKTKSAGTMGYMPRDQMHLDNYDKSVDIVAYAVTVTELFTNDLLYSLDDRDEDIDDEYQTYRVADRATQKLNSQRVYIPSSLVRLIQSTLRCENKSLDPFIVFFESSLKDLAFSLDTPRNDMKLLSRITATPARAAFPR
ncbi:kinase-like domain-containing protein [Blastocladiella britannica]|nr:kinase-like domain-containing protein [Blastocladiella britannica]